MSGGTAGSGISGSTSGSGKPGDVMNGVGGGLVW